MITLTVNMLLIKKMSGPSVCLCPEQPPQGPPLSPVVLSPCQFPWGPQACHMTPYSVCLQIHHHHALPAMGPADMGISWAHLCSHSPAILGLSLILVSLLGLSLHIAHELTSHNGLSPVGCPPSGSSLVVAVCWQDGYGCIGK